MKANKQDIKDIDVLQGLEGIRRRPEMYISSVSNPKIGLLHLLKECTDNSVDECLHKRCNNIKVIVSNKENSQLFTVADDGGGIPISKHEKTGVSGLETILLNIHAGSKFSSTTAIRGCFWGGTKIQLLNGTFPTIKELYKQYLINQKPFWVFSFNTKLKKWEPKKCTQVHRTKKVTTLAEVTLDNNEVIYCTEDHPFLSLHKGYIKAEDLVEGQSLRSFPLLADKDGYLYINTNGLASKRIHQEVAEHFDIREKGKQLHHKDRNKTNNTPENLMSVTAKEHTEEDPSMMRGLFEYIYSDRNRINKREMLTKRNSQEWYKKEQQLGKIIKICTRIVRNNLKINEINYKKYYFHGAPGWEIVISEYSKLDLRKLVDKFGKFISDEALDYDIGFSDTSIINDHSVEMVAKRLQGRILSAINRLSFRKKVNIREISKALYVENKINNDPTLTKIKEIFPDTKWSDILELASGYNHKVKNIKIIECEPTWVYDLTVEDNHNYLIAAGVFVHNTHGVGIKTVSALTSKLDVWTFRNKKWFNLTIEKGELTGKLNSKTPVPKLLSRWKCGTIMRYTPDYSIFKGKQSIKKEWLVEWFSQLVFLTPGLSIELIWDGESSIFQATKGLSSYLDLMLEENTSTPIGKSFVEMNDFYSIALVWTDSSREDLRSFVSGSPTKNGGTHVNVLYKAINAALSPFKNNKDKYTAEDLRNGLFGIINAHIKNPKFAAQVKDELVSDIEFADDLKEKLVAFFAKNTPLARKIVTQASMIYKAKENLAKQIKAVKKATRSSKTGILPGVLTEASPDVPAAKRELFILEGESASGCFLGSTSILLEYGTKTFIQLVEDYEKGILNKGYAFDLETKEIKTVPLLEPRITKHIMKYIKITLNTNEVIECTRDHLYMLYDGQYVKAKDLVEGDYLMSFNSKLYVAKTEFKKARKSIPVYDLTVDSYSNFALASEVFVHNSSRDACLDFQEILPIRGKFQNAIKTAPSSFFKESDKSIPLRILTALGTGIGKDCKPEEMRIGKVMIMCFTGDTKVPLVDGRTISLKKMAKEWEANQEPFWLYATNKKGEIVPAEATSPRITGTTKRLIEVELDNGHTVRCTPDHLWIVNPIDADDERIVWKKGLPYIQAKDLVEGDSLKSCYLTKQRYWKKKYLCLIKSKPKPNLGNEDIYEFVHKWVVRNCKPKSYRRLKELEDMQVHHKNENPFDNTPSNLKVVSKVEHRSIHGKKSHLVTDFNGSEEQKAKLQAARDRGAYDNVDRTRLIEHNQSEANKKSTRKLNRNDDVKELQWLGKYARFYLGLKKQNIKINEENWNSYETSSKLKCNYGIFELSDVRDFIKERGLTLEDGYDLVPREKRSYPTQRITKFVTMCKKVIEEVGVLTKKKYIKERARMIASKEIPQGTPKWESGLEYCGLVDKPIDEIREFVATYNMSVKSVRRIRLEEEVPVYCLTVKSTGNFGISGGYKEFKLNKENPSLITHQTQPMMMVSNCDGDDDGNHIESLLLSFFAQYLPALIKQGRLFIVEMPLFTVTHKDIKYFGDSLDELKSKLPKSVDASKLEVIRMKGLAEASVAALKEFAFDPKTRKLLQVLEIKPEHKKLMLKVMGEDSSYRKKLLST